MYGEAAPLLHEIGHNRWMPPDWWRHLKNRYGY
jgi:hypothetical protein